MSKEQGLVVIFWAKSDPICAKWDPSGQFVWKVGKSALELGKKNTIILLQTKAKLVSSLNLAIIHWSLSKNKAKEQFYLFQSNSVQSSRCKLMTCPGCPVSKKSVPDSNKTQLLQMVVHKSLETISLWFWIHCYQNLESNFWQPCRDLHWLDELQF